APLTTAITADSSSPRPRFAIPATEAAYVVEPPFGPLGSTVRFGWTKGRGVSSYRLRVYRDAIAYFDLNVGSNTSHTVTGLPTDGGLLSVELTSIYGTGGQFSRTTVYNTQNTGTQLSSAPNGSAVGTPVTITATLPAGKNGIVTFYDGVHVIGAATSVNGVA